MPEKKDPYSTPAMKALGLFCLLLFSRRKYSLSKLAGDLRCSKQTVIRYVEQLQLIRNVKIETSTQGREKYYRARPPRGAFNVTLDPEQIHHLLLCRDLVWNLLPDSLRNGISDTIRKATALLPDDAVLDELPEKCAWARPKGAIDYSGKQDIFQRLLAAMKDHQVCKIRYAKPGQEQPATHYVAPFRLMLSGECVYVLAWYLWEDAVPDDPHKMTLALHRLVSAETTEHKYEKKDFLDEQSIRFGLIDGEPFQVRVAFRPSAAVYIKERNWSEGQQMVPQPDGGVILEFTATSRLEVLSWVLGFGSQAELLEPEDLRSEIRSSIRDMSVLYGDPE